MHAKIAFGAVAVLAVVGGIAIYTRSTPHGELPEHAEGSATPHLATAGEPRGGSGSAVEKPWLSREATEQLIDTNGGLGPLFAGVALGGPAPADEVKARIAAFAKANDVAIELEVVDHKLVAVRLDVTFGGCCGYEGADKLGLRLQRPGYNNGDGTPRTFANAWSYELDDKTHVRVDLRVNRVRARWEHALTAAQVLERAETLVGAKLATVQATAGDRVQTIFDGKYLIEVPYQFTPRSGYYGGSSYADRYDLGIIVTAEGGVITEAAASWDRDNERIQAEIDKAMRARWGPRHETDSGATWRTATHRIELEFYQLTIRPLR